MKRYWLIVLLTGCFLTSKSQTTLQADSGSFLLHKFEQHIGREVYHITKQGGQIIYNIDFKFVDRGSPVPLKAVLVLAYNQEPLSLKVSGNNSRSSSLKDTVIITGNTAHIKVDDSAYTKTIGPLTYPVAGYAPGTVQQALIKYWKKHHQPANITTLPFGSVQIKRDGTDTLTYNGKQMMLERYTVGGLIWGHELLWTDNQARMMCLITNDAEADKLEMMREPYEALLPTLISRAADYSMRLLANGTRKSGPVSKVMAITGGNMVDVISGVTTPNSIIIIENGMIKAAGTAGSITVPAGAKIIDAKGKTVLPGLWDMHAHFEQAEWGPAYLAAGVTTVRDCGNEFGYINAIKKAIDDGHGVGPEILKAGIIDGKGPYALGIIQADTKEEAVKAVDRYYNNGFIQIKIYSSVKPEIVKAICDEAHRLGLTVTGHIPDYMTIKQGIDSGMDMVNHINYVASIMKKDKNRNINFNDSVTIAAIAFIKQHHTVIDPTLGVYEMVFRSVSDDIREMEPNFYTLPLPLQAIFKNTGMPADKAAKYKPLFQSWMKLVKVLYDAGVPIVAGTDQGFPGYSLDRELELYVMAGLTPIEAIQCATITPARVMKLDKRNGSITPGKQANLVIIDGNPLSNIRDIRKVSLVIKAGTVYDPGQMHRLVGFGK